MDRAGDLRQLQTLAVNICKMDQNISNRKQNWSTAISPEFTKQNLMNFGTQTKKL